jgi:hypothetical protein
MDGKHVGTYVLVYCSRQERLFAVSFDSLSMHRLPRPPSIHARRIESDSESKEAANETTMVVKLSSDRQKHGTG